MTSALSSGRHVPDQAEPRPDQDISELTVNFHAIHTDEPASLSQSMGLKPALTSYEPHTLQRGLL